MSSAIPAREFREAVRVDPRPYALGYSEGEFRRLERQGEHYRELTEQLLVSAGIGPGMRVLDVGCGVGDVSLIAARLVGPSGSVLGIDRSQEAIDIAARRTAIAARDRWVRFSATEIGDHLPEGRFDAVIGRLILMYLPDPAAALRRFATCLEPGGILAFQEIAIAQARTVPEMPLFRKCLGWIIETFDRSGFEANMGDRLYRTFLDAGFVAPRMIAGARVEGGPDSFAYDYVTQTVQSLLPAGVRVGSMTRAEVGIDSLTDRLRDEALRHSACVVLPTLIGAWATTA